MIELPFFKDRKVTYPRRYVLINNVNGTTTLQPSPEDGSNIPEEEGTPLYASHLNNMCTGILQAAPPGCVMWFAAPTPPAGWLVCNGATLSRIDYSYLFAAIGTIWGSGDGSTTFKIPDIQKEFIRGWDGTSTFGTKQAATVFSQFDDGWGLLTVDREADSVTPITKRVRDIQGSFPEDWGVYEWTARPRNIPLLPIIKY